MSRGLSTIAELLVECEVWSLLFDECSKSLEVKPNLYRYFFQADIGFIFICIPSQDYFRLSCTMFGILLPVYELQLI